jgi:hypothetical protein
MDPQPRGGDGVSARVEWTFNPWRERPAVAFAAAAGVVLILALMIASRMWALPLFLLLLAVHSQLGPAYWPERFRLEPEGVSRGRLGALARRPWSTFRRADLRRDGLLLSPRAVPSRLDTFQAVFLPFPAAERERLREEVQPLIAEHGLQQG